MAEGQWTVPSDHPSKPATPKNNDNTPSSLLPILCRDTEENPGQSVEEAISKWREKLKYKLETSVSKMSVMTTSQNAMTCQIELLAQQLRENQDIKVMKKRNKNKESKLEKLNKEL